jgi:hypothetical protein
MLRLLPALLLRQRVPQQVSLISSCFFSFFFVVHKSLRVTAQKIV